MTLDGKSPHHSHITTPFTHHNGCTFDINIAGYLFLDSTAQRDMYYSLCIYGDCTEDLPPYLFVQALNQSWVFNLCTHSTYIILCMRLICLSDSEEDGYFSLAGLSVFLSWASTRPCWRSTITCLPLSSSASVQTTATRSAGNTRPF